MPRRVTPEGYVKTAVCELLALHRISHHRLNSGVLLAESQGKRRAIRLAPRGTADILALVPRDGGGVTPLYIECKAPKGTQSPAQKEFQAEVVAQGHAYLLCRDVDQVVAWLREGARA